MKSIYLDYAATTPVDPRVAQVMAACLTLDGTFGNAASRSHRYGWQAEQVVENARRQLADLLAADPREIVWTSGATESNNLALKGVVEALRADDAGRPLHIITSAIEHKAVLDVCAWLQARQQVEVTYLTPDADGLIGVQQVADALRDDTCLVSLMAVNNELGTITDIAAIGALLKDHPAYLHVDAAQALGKVAVNVRDWQVDLLSVSAHKFYGPKGIGALYVRREPQVKLAAQMHGGGHERGMRSGTLPTHQLAGLGEAARLVQEELAADEARIGALRDQLWNGLQALGGVYLNGHTQQRTANHLNVSFDGVDGEILLASLAKVAVSSGSACNSATVAPSYVLKAIGRSDALAHAGLRFSLGRFTTAEEIDFALSEVTRVVQMLRG
ncbi:aminotransferase class V-fold PLP-dependent enzyme [Thalassolituus sp. ST750PaO-4]|uniref:aminotransferase class V-fold PLP-dependent enzyme n=1 Tax=Thalassolituus sp. ST750PaO-4 TaxID=2742965 RepID=UPI001CE35317|nr:aminotransferase class V-fold PLP-dependent enzyme [Thalassolituus sp. ST750PaO-4]MCA6059395.1 aminotransferase class V-fold PLP-dependent enzyme [Thalassolituus sp. ST750PaO-4]